MMTFSIQFRAEEDKKSFCFICSIPSYEFERKGKVCNAYSVGTEKYLHMQGIIPCYILQNCNLIDQNRL